MFLVNTNWDREYSLDMSSEEYNKYCEVFLGTLL